MLSLALAGLPAAFPSPPAACAVAPGTARCADGAEPAAAPQPEGVSPTACRQPPTDGTVHTQPPNPLPPPPPTLSRRRSSGTADSLRAALPLTAAASVPATDSPGRPSGSDAHAGILARSTSFTAQPVSRSALGQQMRNSGASAVHATLPSLNPFTLFACIGMLVSSRRGCAWGHAANPYRIAQVGDGSSQTTRPSFRTATTSCNF